MIKPMFLSCIFCFIFIAVKSQKNYNEITLPELMKKLEKRDPNMIILDVRTKGEYYDSSSVYQQSNIGHIKGAINIPLQDFRKDPATVHQLDAYKDKNIYVICSHSYRSRVVSKLLLDSGFIHINNTRGGMTEFFRRYNEVVPFKNNFYETSINYQNIAPAQLFDDLSANKNPLIISIGNTPRYFWDSLNVTFNKFYPAFKNEMNFNYADSLQILELAKKENGRPVVLYNNTNYGAAELANWLTRKGIHKVAYLVGNTYLFYEYIVNSNLTSSASKFLKMNSDVRFITPSVYCDQWATLRTGKIIDLRHDSLFNGVTHGAKYNYKHLKNASNFFAENGIEKFEKQFSDKQINYILISENGIDGLPLADDLSKKGYRINWLIGGMQRWEWYMNNVETFKCMDYFID